MILRSVFIESKRNGKQAALRCYRRGYWEVEIFHGSTYPKNVGSTQNRKAAEKLARFYLR